MQHVGVYWRRDMRRNRNPEGTMAKTKTTTPEAEPPPAPAADVMTPDPPERNPPAREAQAEQSVEDVVKAALGFVPTARDGQAMFEALARLARLRGYSDHYLPEHKGDIDLRGVSEQVVGLVDFARKA